MIERRLVHAFPIFLDLKDRPCLVVGGGSVGMDKAECLASAGADVLVVDPFLSSALRRLSESGLGIAVRIGPFVPGDCDGRLLVFACTNQPEVNDHIVSEASRRRIFVCRCDSAESAELAPAAGEGPIPRFATGAVLQRGLLTVAVSSSGASPTLAADARDRIAGIIGEEYAEAASILSVLRERLHVEVPDSTLRIETMRSVVDAGLLEFLRDGHREEAAKLVAAALERARGGIHPGDNARTPPCIH